MSRVWAWSPGRARESHVTVHADERAEAGPGVGAMSWQRSAGRAGSALRSPGGQVQGYTVSGCPGHILGSAGALVAHEDAQGRLRSRGRVTASLERIPAAWRRADCDADTVPAGAVPSHCSLRGPHQLRALSWERPRSSIPRGGAVLTPPPAFHSRTTRSAVSQHLLPPGGQRH